jgi:hypothetical protein
MLLSLKKLTLATALLVIAAVTVLYVIPYLCFTKAIDSFSSWIPGRIVVANTKTTTSGVMVTESGQGIHISHQWQHGPKEFFLSGNRMKNLAKMRTTGSINDVNIIATTHLHWDLSTTTVWETKERVKNKLDGLVLQRVSGLLRTEGDSSVFSWNIDKPCWHNKKSFICANEVVGDSIFVGGQWEHRISFSSGIATNNGKDIINIYGANFVAHMKIGEEIQGNFDLYFDKISSGTDELYRGVILSSVENLKPYVINDVIKNNKLSLNRDAKVRVYEASVEVDGVKMALNASLSGFGEIKVEGSVPQGVVDGIIRQDIKSAMAMDVKGYDLNFEGLKIPKPTLRTKKETTLDRCVHTKTNLVTVTHLYS